MMNSTLGAGRVGPPEQVQPAPPNGAGEAEPTCDTVFTPLTPEDPREISGYLLRARIGEGGMGAVYLSYTPGGRPVAVKVARPEFAADPEFRRRFASEVAVAQRVQGLYTASVIDAGPHASRPWLATVYVAAPSLAAVLSRHGPLPADTVLVLLAGVAEALHSIHAAGVIHRDLKPGNIILAADGPRVIDFGIARAVEASSVALTRTGALIGTPAFMPPEQVQARPLDPAVDVFALGATAYYSVTGALPFGADAAVFHRIVHEQPDWDRCPEQIRGVLQQCVAKDPAARPTAATLVGLCRAASADERLRIGEGWLPPTVSAELTRYNLTPPAPPAPPPSLPSLPSLPSAEAVPSRSAEPPVPPPSKAGRKRSPWLVGGLSTAVLAATLVVLLLAVRNNAPPGRSSDGATAPGSVTASDDLTPGGSVTPGDGLTASGSVTPTAAAALEDVSADAGSTSGQVTVDSPTPGPTVAPDDLDQTGHGDALTAVAPGNVSAGTGTGAGQPMPSPTANASTPRPPATVPAGPVAADPAASYNVFLKNQNSGLCIDDSVSQGLRHNSCNAGSYQRWNLSPMGDGSYQIRNANSGLCIDDSVSQGLRHNSCNAGSYQRWYR